MVNYHLMDCQDSDVQSIVIMEFGTKKPAVLIQTNCCKTFKDYDIYFLVEQVMK